MDTSNASITLDWTDSSNRHSFLLVLEDYGLKLLRAVDIDDDTCEITLYGPADDIDTFCEDYDDDAFCKLDCMSSSLEYDEDYEGWLNNEVWYVKQLMQLDGLDFTA